MAAAAAAANTTFVVVVIIVANLLPYIRKNLSISIWIMAVCTIQNNFFRSNCLYISTSVCYWNRVAYSIYTHNIGIFLTITICYSKGKSKCCIFSKFIWDLKGSQCFIGIYNVYVLPV